MKDREPSRAAVRSTNPWILGLYFVVAATFFSNQDNIYLRLLASTMMLATAGGLGYLLWTRQIRPRLRPSTEVPETTARGNGLAGVEMRSAGDGAWAISPGVVEWEVRGRRFVAELSEDELPGFHKVIADLTDALKSGSGPIDVGAAFRAGTGRDPFEERDVRRSWFRRLVRQDS